MSGEDRRLRPGVAYGAAAAAAAVLVGAAIRALAASDEPSAAVVFFGSGAAVALVLAVTAGRLGLRPSLRTLAAAPVLGLLLAAAAHLLIILPLSVVYEPAQELVDVLIAIPAARELDTRLMIVLLVTAAVLAPLTEEPAKAVSGNFARPITRPAAFLAGVTAGAGFAIVEDGFYALPAAEYADVWVQVLLLRSASAAMHPLATGLVFLGWWEYRRSRSSARLLRGLGLGIGVHAAWNATAIVMEGVAAIAQDGQIPRSFEALALAYAGAVGMAIAFLLWRAVTAVDGDEVRPRQGDGLGPPPVVEWPADRRPWLLVAAALVVPLVLLIVVLPSLP